MVLIAEASICLTPGPAYSQDLSAENTKTTIHGTVVNSVTHAPIGRALVHSTDQRFATFTNAEGQFEFSLPAAGSDRVNSNLWLTASKPGFLENPAGRNQFDARAGSDITIALIPEGLIEGRVGVSASEAAARVAVQLYMRQVREGRFHWTQINSTRTNSNGEFRFAELQRGAYKILTSEWGERDPEVNVPGGQEYEYPPAYYLGEDFGTAGLIDLKPGESVHADLTITRQAYYPVIIPVVTGDAGRGVNVKVALQGRPGPGYSLGYMQGSQKIQGSLPNGKYLVEGSSYGADSGSGWVNLTVAGGPAEGPTLVLATENPIPVDVREEFSSQAENSSASSGPGNARRMRNWVNLSAEPVDDFARRNGVSLREPAGPNEDSLYLDKIAPGKYWLRMFPMQGYVASASMGAADLLREPMTVVAGGSTPIEITIRDDFAELSGEAAGVFSPAAENGGRARPQQIYIYCVPLPDSSGQFQEFGISGDGKFDSSRLAPGTYRVMAFSTAQRDIPYREAEAMRAYENVGQVVRLTAGQKTSVQLEVSAGVE